MFRRCGSLDTSHSDSERSLDSTARSRWQSESSSPKSADSDNINVSMRGSLLRESKEHVKERGKLRIAEGGIRSRKSVTVVRHFPPGCGRNVRGQPEKDKEKVIVASKPFRKVSGVRHFPPGCGRNAAPVSDEEYRRIQQAWIEEQRKKKSQEENSEEDL